jgi:phage gp36-like protein
VAYAVQDDLGAYIDSATLIRLTDDASAGVVGAAVVTSVLADVQARIDGALLAAGYTVPVAVPGAMLRSLCARLALAALYGRRPMVEAPASITTVADAAEADLKAIAAGKVRPPEAVKADAATAPGGLAVSSDSDVGWSEDVF